MAVGIWSAYLSHTEARWRPPFRHLRETVYLVSREPRKFAPPCASLMTRFAVRQQGFSPGLGSVQVALLRGRQCRYFSNALLYAIIACAAMISDIQM